MKGDVDIFRYAITGIKPFYATGLFLYPLKKIQKTSGLLQVSWFRQYIKFSPTKNFRQYTSPKSKSNTNKFPKQFTALMSATFAIIYNEAQKHKNQLHFSRSSTFSRLMLSTSDCAGLTLSVPTPQDGQTNSNN